MPSHFDAASLFVHCVAVALLALGVVLTRRAQPANQASLDRMIAFGPTLFAVPFGVFGLQHFTDFSVVVQAVPRYMPARNAWAYFVGAALVAAALSIITSVKANWAAPLLGLTLFLFVLMIYVPGLMRAPHNRFVQAVTLRDLALSGGALSLAGTLLSKQWLKATGRWFFGFPMVFFGIEHFLHPDFVPGVPLQKMMPAWMPAHSAWAYLTGAALVIFGLGVLLTNRGRLAAACLGIVYVVLVILVYMPMEIVHPSNEISGELDYVADTLAMSGAALLVAGAFGSGRLRTMPEGQARTVISAG